MLKELLDKRKISVYQLSKLANVPYTTVNEIVLGKKNIDDCSVRTISKLARALNLPVDYFYKKITGSKIDLADNWNLNKNKRFIFPIIKDSDKYEAKYIHPLKQKIVDSIYEALSKEESVEKIIIFGSAINIRCNNKSDIDIAIKLKDNFYNNEYTNKISEIIGKITNYNSDIIWLNNIDNSTQLYHNIMGGLTIYE